MLIGSIPIFLYILIYRIELLKLFWKKEGLTI